MLVERIEGFCSADDWNRGQSPLNGAPLLCLSKTTSAFYEINDFEEQLSEDGIAVVRFALTCSVWRRGGLDAAWHTQVKFWVHITADEQLKRFKEREQTPYKQVLFLFVRPHECGNAVGWAHSSN